MGVRERDAGAGGVLVLPRSPGRARESALVAVQSERGLQLLIESDVPTC